MLEYCVYEGDLQSYKRRLRVRMYGEDLGEEPRQEV